MPRKRTLGFAAIILFVVVVTVFLVALPTIARRVAVDRLTKLTGRAVSLDRVEVNVFTGRVGLTGFRLAQRGSNEPALELDGLEVRASILSLLTKHVRVPSITLTAPRLYVARLTPTEFDFSDLLALIPPADPKPSGRTVSIARVTIVRGSLVARDAVTSTLWKLEDLNVDGADLSTRGGPPGRLAGSARLNGAPLGVEVGSIDLAKGVIAALVKVDNFDLAQVRPFVPASLGVMPAAGRLSVALDIKAEKTDASPRVAIAGEARVEGLAIHKAAARGDGDAIVNVGRVVVSIKEAHPLARVITLDSVTVDGLDLRVVRDKQGVIDLLTLVAPPSPGVGSPGSRKPPEPPPVAASAGITVALGELAVRGAKVTLRDESVGTTLALSDLTATVRDVAWPPKTPLTFDVATGLPSAGRLLVKGSATLAPVVTEFTMSMRGAPLAPYQPYLPIPGRIVGVFNGESRTRVSMADGKLTVGMSRGRTWIDGLELRAPGAPSTAPGASETVPVKIARVAIDGVDFTYPGHAAAKTITISKPEIRIERAANGDINIRSLFAAETPEIRTTHAAPPVATAVVKPASTAAQAEPLVLSVPMPLEIGSVIIEDGFARFLDRSTTPAFSEDVSRLAVRLDGLSSAPGRRAKLAVQAIVGGDSALDLKGEIAPFGDLYADVEGELRNFVLPSVNPYADNAIAWIVEKGTLAVKLHYTIEKNQITAKNEIIVENLHVARSSAEDQVQKRIGLPLGLIVALITDSDNGIRVNLPISGSLQTWGADFSDAIWSVVKNVAVNILAAPFRAIGRMFTGSGDKIESLAIDPVKFAAGSASLADDVATHLTKVADFLRRSPAIKLTLAPLTTPADADSLREQELAARLQRVQREAKLPDPAAAIAAEFARAFPGEPLPKTTEERLAKLREREPAPTAAVSELATRRLETVRQALTEKEGIPTARLVTGDAGNAPTGDGRVEFRIGQ